MKTLQISIIVGVPVVIAITVISIVFFLSSNLLEPKKMEGMLCETTITIVYGEPAKYNQTLILNALRNNLSKDNFGDVYGTDLWWKYVSISAIEENGAVKLAIPSGDGKTINMTEKIVSKIDGISRILPSVTVWCT